MSTNTIRSGGGHLTSEARTLFHFTCEDHGARGIDASGRVLPGSMTGLSFPQSQFAWFTDLDAPPRAALGLAPVLAKCDRLARRYSAWSEDREGRTVIYPWVLVRRTLPVSFVDLLESTPGAMPRHWFVAAESVEVTR